MSSRTYKIVGSELEVKIIPDSVIRRMSAGDIEDKIAQLNIRITQRDACNTQDTRERDNWIDKLYELKSVTS